MRAFLLSLLISVTLPFALLAQTEGRPNTILVLDGSGSMWGQIDGINKIVIAREVIAELLADMPDEESLGLTVYGHRRRGDCSDIETIVAPAPFTQDRILEEVMAINPRGRTPMTDAVVAAAQALRHTEEPATVILVSDGVETCEADPCALAAELEAAGIGFTAHVVGFDVASEPEARAQMQCIADNTGGLFLSADNASELSAALEQVVAATPLPVDVEILARVMPGNTPPVLPVDIYIETVIGDTLTGPVPGGAASASLLPGDYLARALREEPGGTVHYTMPFVVAPNTPLQVVVEMPPVDLPVPVTFRATEDPGGSAPQSPLEWTLRDAAGAVLLGPVETPGGNVELLPGDYTIDAVRLVDGTQLAATVVVEDAAQEVVLNFPEMPIEIAFTARIGAADGPLVQDPIIWTVSPEIGELAETINPGVTELLSGAYEVEAYWTAEEISETVAFDMFGAPREIIVIFPEQLPEASVTAPASAVAGSRISVAWTGPNEADDYIGIGLTDGSGSAWETYTYTRDGNPLEVLVPIEPGEYTVSYFLNEGRQPLANTPLTVTPVEASLSAPETAVAGSTIEVGWTGPNYADDYIGIGLADGSGSAWENYTYTREGSPLQLRVPENPGAYLISYFANQDRTQITTVPITVTEAVASVTAPAEATAGETIEVTWTGPNYADDYIGIGRADGSASAWENYTYTREGSPLEILVPATPGDYVIQYFLNQDRTPIAETAITVREAGASVSAPAEVTAGAMFEVTWTGPNYDDDYIGIGRADGSGSAWENYTYTREGNPLQILAPATPGDYLVQYFLNQDRTSIAEVPITVKAVEATISTVAEAVAGSTIEVTWTGPNYDGDYVGIGRADGSASAWENYENTRDGNPLQILVPVTPGDYLVQYFLNQDRTPIATVPLIVREVSASITPPEKGSAGEEVQISWTGPNYDGDYIGIGRADGTGSDWASYAYTRDGSPAMLTLPEEPGAYVIRYFLSQDRTPIAEVPFQIE